MENFRVQTVDGFNLAATLTRGKANDVIIWMHGISVDKDEYLGFFREGAQWFRQQGASSIRFDFRGHGESSGTPLDFTVVGQMLDVRAILSMAEQHFGPDPRLHIVAASFGCPPAIFAGVRLPAKIQSLSLIAPVLSYERTFLSPETEWGKEIFSTENVSLLNETGKLCFDDSFYIGHRLIEEMRLIDPESALRRLKQRVLVFHGDQDSMVPYNASIAACKGLDRVRLVTLSGADHGFVDAEDDEGTSDSSIRNKLNIFQMVKEHIGK